MFLFCSKDVKWNFYLFFWRVIVSFTDAQIFLYLWKDILFVLGSRSDVSSSSDLLKCPGLASHVAITYWHQSVNQAGLKNALKSWQGKPICSLQSEGKQGVWEPQSEERQKSPKGKQRTAVPWRKTLHFKSIESLCLRSGRLNLHCWIYNFFIVLNSLLFLTWFQIQVQCYKDCSAQFFFSFPKAKMVYAIKCGVQLSVKQFLR